jgi:hypothetical protein
MKKILEGYLIGLIIKHWRNDDSNEMQGHLYKIINAMISFEKFPDIAEKMNELPEIDEWNIIAEQVKEYTIWLKAEEEEMNYKKDAILSLEEKIHRLYEEENL